MKPLIKFVTLLSLIWSCAEISAGQVSETPAPSLAAGRTAQEADEDRVYTSSEVDVRAKITNKMENLPEPGKDCPNSAGLVRLKVVLHKSGRVTEVIIVKGMGCSYDEAVVGAARKFKFVPAVKDGKQVSQYQIFEYQYRGL